MSAISEILQAIFRHIKLVIMMIRYPLIPINSWHWSLANIKKNTHCFQVSKERKVFQSIQFSSAFLVTYFQLCFKQISTLQLNFSHYTSRAKNLSHSIRKL